MDELTGQAIRDISLMVWLCVLTISAAWAFVAFVRAKPWEWNDANDD